MSSIDHREVHEQNRKSWNAATRAHNQHKGDQAAFFRKGGDTLFPDEVELLGSLEGRSLLHLQCNAGQDSLSLAHRGANVVGVDICDEAIEFARRLSKDSGIPAEFHRANLVDWLRAAKQRGQTFDLIFASYGVMPWMSDLSAWADGLSGLLADGGRFVLVEFHPVLGMFDEELRHVYPYSSAGHPVEFEGVGDYVAASETGLLHGATPGQATEPFENPHVDFEFFWGVGEIINALLQAGLRLAQFKEYDYINGYKSYSRMTPIEGNRFVLPEDVAPFPLMYGLVCEKAG